MTQIATPLGSALGYRRGRAFDLDAVISLWRQRRALGRLDERALVEIGVTPAQARAEAARPLWDLPASWRD